MLELIFKGLVEWLYGLILECWEYFSAVLLNVMSMDFAYLQQRMPVLESIQTIFLAAGWALLIGNLAFQAVKTMLSGIGFEGEDPKLLFARTFVFAFLLLASPQICEICMNMTSTLIRLLQVPDAMDITFADEASFSGLAAAWILVVICGIIVMFQSFKLILEMAERYLILTLLTLSAPLAFGVGGSRNTSDIFSGWCRMYGSMCLLMVMQVVFIKMLLSILSFYPSGLDVLPWMILVIATVKVAKKVDAIITRIGLNPALTGDPLGRTFPGALTYMVMRTAASQVTKAIGKSTGGNGGRSPNVPPGGSGGPRGGGSVFRSKTTGSSASYTQQKTSQSASAQTTASQTTASKTAATQTATQQTVSAQGGAVINTAQEQSTNSSRNTATQFQSPGTAGRETRKSSVTPGERYRNGRARPGPAVTPGTSGQGSGRGGTSAQTASTIWERTDPGGGAAGIVRTAKSGEPSVRNSAASANRYTRVQERTTKVGGAVNTARVSERTDAVQKPTGNTPANLGKQSIPRGASTSAQERNTSFTQIQNRYSQRGAVNSVKATATTESLKSSAARTPAAPRPGSAGTSAATRPERPARGGATASNRGMAGTAEKEKADRPKPGTAGMTAAAREAPTTKATRPGRNEPVSTNVPSNGVQNRPARQEAGKTTSSVAPAAQTARLPTRNGTAGTAGNTPRAAQEPKTARHSAVRVSASAAPERPGVKKQTTPSSTGLQRNLTHGATKTKTRPERRTQNGRT